MPLWRVVLYSRLAGFLELAPPVDDVVLPVLAVLIGTDDCCAGESIALTEITATTGFETLVQLVEENPDACLKLADSEVTSAKSDANERGDLLKTDLNNKRSDCDKLNDGAVSDAERAKDDTARAAKDAEAEFTAAQNEKITLSPITFSKLNSGSCQQQLDVVKSDEAFQKHVSYLCVVAVLS